VALPELVRTSRWVVKNSSMQSRYPVDAAYDQQFTGSKGHTHDGARQRRTAIRTRNPRITKPCTV
jgi:hypothetical protein